MRDNIIEAFFALVRSGLWETDVQLAPYGEFDYTEVMRLAQEQAVVGLVAAGLEHVTDVKVPQVYALQFAGETLQLEQRNKAMNLFVAELVERMRNAGIFALLVKGQGIAQCYERPLWRSCGDIDLLLDENNYTKAQHYLQSIAERNEGELKEEKHHEFSIDSWVVELHGNMPMHFSKRTDSLLTEIQEDAFKKRVFRVWKNEAYDIYLLDSNADVLFVFTHILKHFFRGGIGLRQICDWIRLLWVYRKKINHQLLEKRLKKMGLLTEWKVFSALAVNVMGYPSKEFPLYSQGVKWDRKSSRLLSFILRTGNFGHNRDTSYYIKYPYLVSKTISFYWRFADNLRYLLIFPLDSIKVLVWLIRHGVKNL